MSTSDLERALLRWREGPDAAPPPVETQKLSVADALAYRNAGNVPDDRGRSLRLVLHIDDVSDLRALDAKRLQYEPDAHDPPTWRTAGSKPVNVVPLRAPDLSAAEGRAWWSDEDMAVLEDAWRATGRVYGVSVPPALRGFVYKTAVALRASGRDVTVDSLCDSIARWVSPEEVAAIRAELRAANP